MKHSTPENVEIGARIRSRREARKFTQELLAKRANLSPGFIARVERGEIGMSLSSAVAVARALAISVDCFARV